MPVSPTRLLLLLCAGALACGGSSGGGGSGGPAGSDAGSGGAVDGGSAADAGPTLPGQVGGETLEVRTLSGAQLLAAGTAEWKQALARAGAAADSSLAVSVPGASGDFQIGQFRIAGADWAPHLAALIKASPAVTFTEVQLGGKTVQRGQAGTDPNRGYYYASGDTLFFITSSNEAKVIDALGQLRGAARAGVKGAEPYTAPPATGVLLATPLLVPTRPLCVGEPANPGGEYIVLLTDGNAVPVTMGFANITTPLGAAFPPATVGCNARFIYQPKHWGGGQGQSITVDAYSAQHGDHTTLQIVPPVQLNVLQCLSGSAWADGGRTIKITSNGATFSAQQTAGSYTCVAPGESFSGTFSGGTTLSGGDFVVCNPAACVGAGLLGATNTAPFSGTLSDDGLSIAMTYDAPAYKLSYQDGTLISCSPEAASPQTFTLTRPFTEPWTP